MSSVLRMPGYDDCIIGIAEGAGKELSVVYDRDKVIQRIMINDGMNVDDAIEHFTINVIGAYMGNHTPVFLEHRDPEIYDNLDEWLEDRYPE